MTIEKQPFRTYTLEEDKTETESQPLVIRINKEERALIDSLKALMHYGQDAKVIKAGLVVLNNVIQGTFGKDLMFKLTQENRRRPIIEEQPEDKKVNL